ncbi:hypothetical protein [Pseudonocardia adelaidensis]|uniref:Uncharacterized protein n=1 Tax=Pseudonocardia adelaidensis TaxID=648754 RepID=A0ABP9NHQ1_9PSEU
MDGDIPAQSDGSESGEERRMAEYVRRVVADAPPSTEVQRSKIAALFAPAVRELMREAREREGRS